MRCGHPSSLTLDTRTTHTGPAHRRQRTRGNPAASRHMHAELGHWFPFGPRFVVTNDAPLPRWLRPEADADRLSVSSLTFLEVSFGLLTAAPGLRDDLKMSEAQDTASDLQYALFYTPYRSTCTPSVHK